MLFFEYQQCPPAHAITPVQPSRHASSWRALLGGVGITLLTLTTPAQANDRAAVEEAAKAILSYMCADQDVPRFTDVTRSNSLSNSGEAALRDLLNNTTGFSLGTYIGAEFNGSQPVSKINAKCTDQRVARVETSFR